MHLLTRSPDFADVPQIWHKTGPRLMPQFAGLGDDLQGSLCASFSDAQVKAMIDATGPASESWPDQGEDWTIAGPPLARAAKQLGWSNTQLQCILHTLTPWNPWRMDYMAWIQGQGGQGRAQLAPTPAALLAVQQGLPITSTIHGPVIQSLPGVSTTVTTGGAPATPPLVPMAGTVPSVGATPPGGSVALSTGFSFSDVPAWAWLAGAGVVAYLVFGRGK